MKSFFTKFTCLSLKIYKTVLHCRCSPLVFAEILRSYVYEWLIVKTKGFWKTKF